MARTCPLCDFRATGDAEWRRHLREAHDWNPSGEPTYVGDMFVAVGFGFVAFLAVMTTTICMTSPQQPPICGQLGLWISAGFASVLAAVLTLLIQPLRRLGYRSWTRNRRAREDAASRLSAAQRARLRRLDDLMWVGIGAGFAVMFLWPVVFGDFSPAVFVFSLLLIAVAAFLRARIRQRSIRLRPDV